MTIEWWDFIWIAFALLFLARYAWRRARLAGWRCPSGWKHELFTRYEGMSVRGVKCYDCGLEFYVERKTGRRHYG